MFLLFGQDNGIDGMVWAELCLTMKGMKIMKSEVLSKGFTLRRRVEEVSLFGLCGSGSRVF